MPALGVSKAYYRAIPAFLKKADKDLPIHRIIRQELRTRIKRLARQIICFSNPEEMHAGIIGLFINRYKFGLLV